MMVPLDDPPSRKDTVMARTSRVTVETVTAATEDIDVCVECFPAGWPDGALAVGCEHGSWSLDTNPATDGAAATPTGDEPVLPLYTVTGGTEVNAEVWTAAGTTPDGQALYTFNGDTPGGAPTGASDTWHVYTPAA